MAELKKALSSAASSDQLSLIDYDLSCNGHSSFAQTRGHSHAWVQAEAAQTLKHLLALYSLLNAESLVCRLPPEILSLIFAWTAFSSPGTSWIHVAQVCRQWRDVALQCQTLWTYITPQHSDVFISMCLQRSGASPLQLHYDFSDVRDCRASRDFAQMVQPYASRFMSIDIVSPPAVMQSLVGRFEEPLSNLKRLTLGAKAPGGKGCVRPFALSEDFASAIPSLHHLSLAYATLPSWDLSLFSGLRTLNLSEQHKSAAPTMDQFLDVLQSCPMLQELSLRNAGPTLGRDATTYPEPRRIVQLKSLRRVSLSQDCFFDIPFVLAHVSIPETARFDVHFLGSSSPSGEGPPSSVHCLPRNSYALRPLKTISNLRLSVQCGLVEVVGLSQDVPDSTPSLCISMKRPHHHQSADESIYDALRQLPSAFARCPLRHLSVAVPVHLASTSDWLDVFAAFPMLERITVEGCSGSPRGNQEKRQAGGRIFGALSTPSSGGRYPVPNLGSLCLRKWTITDETASHAKKCMRARAQDPNCTTPVQLLVNCNEWSLDNLEVI